MHSDFFPGIIVGLILGIMITMIGLTILARYGTPKKVVEEDKYDPADWWKKGEPPPS